MNKSSEYLVKHKIKLLENEIDLEEAERIGSEVIYKGRLCAYYIEDGFYSYSAYAKVCRGNFSNAFRVCNIVAFLNPDISTEILFSYMDLVCNELFDTDDFKVDRKILLKNINKVKDGLYNVTPSVKKYFWVKPYDKIGREDKEIDGVLYDGKPKIVMSLYNKSRSVETVSIIDNAINTLIEVGNEYGTFITHKDIQEVSGLSMSTIKRLSFIFKDDIDNYNKSNFNTERYGEFIKFVSVNKITSTIRFFIDKEEVKLTQRKVALKSNLHFNTVCSLWSEDDVQEALEEYNDWLKEIKKAAQ
jgi:hypothetical protein